MECGDAPGLSFHYTYRSDNIDLSKSEGKIRGCTLTIEYGLHIQDVWDMGSRYADTPRTV